MGRTFNLSHPPHFLAAQGPVNLTDKKSYPSALIAGSQPPQTRQWILHLHTSPKLPSHPKTSKQHLFVPPPRLTSAQHRATPLSCRLLPLPQDLQASRRPTAHPNLYATPTREQTLSLPSMPTASPASGAPTLQTQQPATTTALPLGEHPLSQFKNNPPSSLQP